MAMPLQDIRSLAVDSDLSEAKPEQRSLQLIGWEELLDWQRDNEYILTNYRRASYSYTGSLSSMFRTHNETVNIWTHLLGAGYFLYATTRLWQSWQDIRPLVTFTDASVVSIYYLGVIVCFVLSTIYHVFLNHSPRMHRFGGQLDYLGIVLVIWGTTIPADYFGFYDEPILIQGYWIMSTFAALGCAYSTMQSRFRTRAYRSKRAFTYLLLGASAFVPVVHGVYLHGWAEQSVKMSIKYFVGLALFNGTGTIIYGLRIPERWFPQKFDKIGASHQIMHVLVVCGALSHMTGVLHAMEYQQQQRTFHV